MRFDRFSFGRFTIRYFAGVYSYARFYVVFFLSGGERVSA